MTQYEIPKRASAEKLRTIIQGYYTEGAHNEPVKTGAVEDAIGASDIVGRQTAFLTEIGILEKDGTSRRLTSSGERLAESLMAGDEAGAKQIFADLLIDWGLSEKVERFTSMKSEGVTREELREYIDSNTSSSNSTGQVAVIDLMEWAGVLNQSEEGNYSVNERNEKSSANDSTHPEKGEDDSDVGESERSNEPDTSGKTDLDELSEGPLTVELEFTASDDAEAVRETIIAAREALSQDLE